MTEQQGEGAAGYARGYGEKALPERTVINRARRRAGGGVTSHITERWLIVVGQPRPPGHEHPNPVARGSERFDNFRNIHRYQVLGLLQTRFETRTCRGPQGAVRERPRRKERATAWCLCVRLLQPLKALV